MMEIRAKCRRLKQRHDLRLVVIDYLQLMTSSARRSSPPAGGLGVLPLAQAARQGARGAGRSRSASSTVAPSSAPTRSRMMSDLRESGCLTAETRILRADTGAETTLGELYAERRARRPGVGARRLACATSARHMTHVFPTGTRRCSGCAWHPASRCAPPPTTRSSRYDGWERARRPGAPGLASPLRDTCARPSDDSTWARRRGRHARAPDRRRLVRAAPADPLRLRRRGQPRRPSRRPRATSASPQCATTTRPLACTTLRLPAPYRLTRGRAQPDRRVARRFGPLRCSQPREVRARRGLLAAQAPDRAVPAPPLGDRRLGHGVGKDGRGGRVYYASTSRRLVDDVSRLLLRFGISCRIRNVPQGRLPRRATPSTSPAATTSGVSSPRSACTARGVSRLSSCSTSCATRPPTPNVDTVPVEVWDTVRGSPRRAGHDVTASSRALGRRSPAPRCGSTSPSRQRLGAGRRGARLRRPRDARDQRRLLGRDRRDRARRCRAGLRRHRARHATTSSPTASRSTTPSSRTPTW